MQSKLITTFTAALVLATTAAGATAAGARAGDRAASAAQAGAKLAVKSSRYGKVLFDGRGYALYLFGADRGTRSACYGACAKAWPPFLTSGKPVAGPGVQARLLGTTLRRDGRLQVTYAGHPLYFYEGDGKGQIKCQNVSNFGGLWLVVAPNGKAVR
jgi:predicted lipoprotein with Yx(FWY)xxD motif